MSLADDLLNLSSNGINSRLADMETEPHIVIVEDRFITVPDELKRIAVQYDHNIETVTFDCPRYWDGRDMSTMHIYINYKRADGEPGLYPVDNVTIDEYDDTIMHFDWTISGHITAIKGSIIFLICVKKSETEIHWNSELCKDLYVSEGLECEQEVVFEMDTLLVEQLLTRMDEVERELKTYLDEYMLGGAW